MFPAFIYTYGQATVCQTNILNYYLQLNLQSATESETSD